MRQSLQLRLGQQLTMTPQLQQAIRLLQLSTLDLQVEIQGALDSNIMLELDEDEGGDGDSPGESSRVEERLDITDTRADTDREVDRSTEDTSFPDELPVDSGWEDVYDNVDGSTSYSRSDDSQGFDILDNRSSGEETLREHLLWQMQLTPMSESDREIALAIIDAVNEDGYLCQSLEDIHQGLDPELGAEMEEVEAVLHRIQRFDPVGVAARDVGECLLLQLQQLPADTPWIEAARLLLREHLDLLAARDLSQLMRRARLSKEDIVAALRLIQSLNPRPGSTMPGVEAQYVVPDVYVFKRDGRWWVELNPESSPRLRINQQYAGKVRRADSSSDNQTLRNHLQEARWFLKSLQNRNETLMKVAICIVEHQRAFLEYGEEAMKPLVLRDVAEAVEMHESTVSRVTTQKYMHTPRGIFEFKYFFSSHVGTSDGGECSSTAIRAMIRKLIAEEPPRKPLSDSKIAQLLRDQGIEVARRTVAKYREAMSIASSTERKRLI